MSKISLLDCTLRDGGYINNWKFGKSEIKRIIKHLVKAKIEIIEVGFLSDLEHDEDCSLYSSVGEIANVCRDKGSSMLAAMIALGEKETNPEKLPLAAEGPLDIVRITFHRDEEEIEKAEKYARILMEKGYKVCMQPIGTAAYSDDALLSLVKRINVLSPYAFYLVDTLGSFYNDDLLRLIYLVDHNLNSDIKLGFHSHNNLQMSFSNAQKVIELHSSREFILDSSLLGMGRGAGNLCTELVARYTNSIGASNYDMVNILEAIDNCIQPIFLKTPWGYNAHYYMAAIHKCHPNYASYLMDKHTLTMNQVNLLLQNLPKETRHIFNKELIKALYNNLQNHSIDDAMALCKLSKIFEGREILLLAPGRSISTHKAEIKEFINEKNPIIISVNSGFHDFKGDFIFISNSKRLYGLDYDSFGENIIVTSNLPSLNEKFVSIDYNRLCDNSFSESDNAGMMLLRLLVLAKVKRAYLAGFDGFSARTGDNYYLDKLVGLVSEEDALSKNASIASQIKKIQAEIEINFLTPSAYSDLVKTNV